MATPEDMAEVEETTEVAPVSEGYTITLEASPENDEAFANCEPGEILKLISKDDGIVLEKQVEEVEEEAEAEVEVADPKSAVDRLKARKMAY